MTQSVIGSRGTLQRPARSRESRTTRNKQIYFFVFNFLAGFVLSPLPFKNRIWQLKNNDFKNFSVDADELSVFKMCLR